MNQTVKPELKSPEMKARFCSNYLGIQCFVEPDFNAFGVTPFVQALSGIDLDNIKDNDYLLLTPLDQISDEDAIEVAKIIHGTEDDDLKFMCSFGYQHKQRDIHESVFCVEVKLFISHPLESRYYLYYLIQFDTEENDIIVGKFTNDGEDLSDDHADNILHAYDFLRSRSYALPYMGHSVQQLIEAGYMKLREGGAERG